MENRQHLMPNGIEKLAKRRQMDVVIYSSANQSTLGVRSAMFTQQI